MMRAMPTIWKANAIVFSSSFCVMVIELIAARVMAPHIGVSLYTWTSIIGVILAGIALGNYLGGKVADRYPSYLLLAAVFFVGGLLTVAILPAVKLVSSGNWFGGLPVMWDFMLKTSCIFLLPAIVLSTVSPLVIKLTLADLGQTGGVVGTIYATSTAGAILGTFMTGFFLILWFGTSMIVWIVGASLIFAGLVIWATRQDRGKWRFSLRNVVMWIAIVEVILAYSLLFQLRGDWQEVYTKESNYFAIRVRDYDRSIKELILDNLVQGYVDPERPHILVYDYEEVFGEIVSYLAQENRAPRLLHLGGGAYTFPRYMDALYPNSVNKVVEIDPLVTEVAHEELGLPRDTRIETHNQDARLFLINKEPASRYDIVIGDVFNDRSTPYHLTTLEFDQLVKSHMKKDGVYLINVIDDYRYGRYMPSFVHTLKQVFASVYLFSPGERWEEVGTSTFVIAATDRSIDLDGYVGFVTAHGGKGIVGIPLEESRLQEYLADRDPILLTDDHVPTDILVARLFR